MPKDYNLDLLPHHSYRLWMMTGAILDVIIINPDGPYETFYYSEIKARSRTKQAYYWDVEHYGELV